MRQPLKELKKWNLRRDAHYTQITHFITAVDSLQTVLLNRSIYLNNIKHARVSNPNALDSAKAAPINTTPQRGVVTHTTID